MINIKINYTEIDNNIFFIIKKFNKQAEVAAELNELFSKRTGANLKKYDLFFKNTKLFCVIVFLRSVILCF